MNKHMDLVRELEKAMQESHHDHLFNQNATHQYIGETWATCGQRKKDFQRRSLKVNKLYKDASEDGTIDATEYGWIILKSRKLALTLSTAAKQGCEWVHEQKMEPEAIDALREVQNHTAKNMPCHKEAMDYLATKPEPTEEDFRGSLSLLFSKDCKVAKPDNSVKDISLEATIAAEEKEEQAASEVAEKLEKENSGSQGDAISALLQRVSEHASQDSQDIEIVIGGLLGIVLGFLILSLVCFIAIVTYAILTVLILGTIWCLMKAMISLLLMILGQYPLRESYGQCVDGWIHWGADFINYNTDSQMFLCFMNVLLAISDAGGPGPRHHGRNYNRGHHRHYEPYHPPRHGKGAYGHRDW